MLAKGNVREEIIKTPPHISQSNEAIPPLQVPVLREEKRSVIVSEDAIKAKQAYENYLENKHVQKLALDYFANLLKCLEIPGVVVQIPDITRQVEVILSGTLSKVHPHVKPDFSAFMRILGLAVGCNDPDGLLQCAFLYHQVGPIYKGPLSFVANVKFPQDLNQAVLFYQQAYKQISQEHQNYLSIYKAVYSGLATIAKIGLESSDQILEAAERAVVVLSQMASVDNTVFAQQEIIYGLPSITHCRVIALANKWGPDNVPKITSRFFENVPVDPSFLHQDDELVNSLMQCRTRDNSRRYIKILELLATVGNSYAATKLKDIYYHYTYLDDSYSFGFSCDWKSKALDRQLAFVDSLHSVDEKIIGQHIHREAGYKRQLFHKVKLLEMTIEHYSKSKQPEAKEIIRTADCQRLAALGQQGDKKFARKGLEKYLGIGNLPRLINLTESIIKYTPEDYLRTAQMLGKLAGEEEMRLIDSVYWYADAMRHAILNTKANVDKTKLKILRNLNRLLTHISKAGYDTPLGLQAYQLYLNSISLVASCSNTFSMLPSDYTKNVLEQLTKGIEFFAERDAEQAQILKERLLIAVNIKTLPTLEDKQSHIAQLLHISEHHKDLRLIVEADYKLALYYLSENMHGPTLFTIAKLVAHSSASGKKYHLSKIIDAIVPDDIRTRERWKLAAKFIKEFAANPEKTAGVAVGHDLTPEKLLAAAIANANNLDDKGRREIEGLFRRAKSKINASKGKVEVTVKTTLDIAKNVNGVLRFGAFAAGFSPLSVMSKERTPEHKDTQAISEDEDRIERKDENDDLRNFLAGSPKPQRAVVRGLIDKQASKGSTFLTITIDPAIPVIDAVLDREKGHLLTIEPSKPA